MNSERLLLIVDLAATVFLGVEGAISAINGGLDLFGIMVLSFATALGGGVVRDLMIGAIPPNAIRDPRYAIAAFLGGFIAFALHGSVQQVPIALMVVIDAAGLGLFAVAGAAKALDYEIKPFVAVLMGTVTGVGGGTIRDILLARVPAVLRVDVYAVAALAGAAVMTIGLRRGLPRSWMMSAGAAVCFVLRMLAWTQHWNLPRLASHP